LKKSEGSVIPRVRISRCKYYWLRA